MNWAKVIKRIEPLALKLAGRLPLCPWRSVLSPLNPRTMSVHSPSMQIEVVEEEGEFKKLRFGGRHESWFPRAARVSLELWSEYLSVFWQHPCNAHYYLSPGTPIVPGDVVMDCGCCEGFFVFQALEAGAAKVVCVEPNPGMVRCLEKTFANEVSAGRVVVVCAALGAFRGRASFSFDAAYPAFGQLGGEADAASVAVETVAAVCERLELKRLDFVKMDIEGAEIQAVEGALPSLRKFHPKLAITTYHREFDFAAIAPLLTAVGYKHVEASGLSDGFNSKRYRPALVRAYD